MADTTPTAEADPDSGVGWYEFITPKATTGIAYVHENGDVFVPDGGWGPTEPFHLATSRGNVHRLIRAAVLDVDVIARAIDPRAFGPITPGGSVSRYARAQQVAHQKAAAVRAALLGEATR